MRVTITEDHPGEITSLSMDEVAAKLYTGFAKASEQLLKGKVEAGGEIDALAELTDALHKGFANRLEAIKAGILASNAE